jgi:ribosome-associated heat shock protein Hsp15
MNRLDKWLFHARLSRTRALAQAKVASGHVRLNGAKVDRPGHVLKPGDVLTLRMGQNIVALRVLSLAEKRGSAGEARALYEAAE